LFCRICQTTGYDIFENAIVKGFCTLGQYLGSFEDETQRRQRSPRIAVISPRKARKYSVGAPPPPPPLPPPELEELELLELEEDELELLDELEEDDDELLELEELDDEEDELDEEEELELLDELELLEDELEELVTETMTAADAAPRRPRLSVAFAVMVKDPAAVGVQSTP
jgi:hypothetical protein